jgi:4-hydroxy-tetrahydrodipicolinate synthase
MASEGFKELAYTLINNSAQKKYKSNNKNMDMDIPDGVHTVLVTPFLADLTIDYTCIDKWLKYQHDSQVTGLVIMGTTSESPTISRTEQFEVIKYIYELNKTYTKPKYITVGVGGNDTIETLEFAKSCIEFTDAFMVTVPSYNKPTQNGLVQHFLKICSNELIKSKPIILYNVPGRTGINMSPETMLEITEHCTNVVAVKEASGSIEQLINLRSMVPKLKVFSGDDNLFIDFMVHGGSGLISVASNIIPKIIVFMINLCIKNNYSEASEFYYTIKFNEFVKSVFCESNPIPIKFMLYTEKIYNNYLMRLPLTSLDYKYHGLVCDSLKIMRIERAIDEYTLYREGTKYLW